MYPSQAVLFVDPSLTLPFARGGSLKAFVLPFARGGSLKAFVLPFVRGGNCMAFVLPFVNRPAKEKKRAKRLPSLRRREPGEV